MPVIASPTFTVLFDACVFYPAPLRDVLMQVAAMGLFRAKWTDRIHEEWISNLLADRADLSRQRLEATKDQINSAVPDCLVRGYDSLIESLSLPDPNDRHVLAAAIKGRADVIVTFNLKDFPADQLTPYSIEALHPDMFLRDVGDLYEREFCQAIKTIRARLKHPPLSVDDYLSGLKKQGLTKTVDLLVEHRRLL